MGKRVFVLGSCVSRDALEVCPGRLDLVGYLARTSLAGISAPPVDDVEARDKVQALGSAFQKRMLSNDLDKTTLSELRSSEYDILLLDFIDERFDLVAVGDSTFSLSGELKNTGFEVGARTIITPGEEAFIARWKAGLEALLSSVDTAKIVLNRAYWAECFEDGTTVSSLAWIRRNNALLRQLYDVVDSTRPLRYIDYPPEILVGDRSHRWGIAPYHYSSAMYQHTIDELVREASSDSVRAPVSF